MAQGHSCPSYPVGLNSHSGDAGKIFTGVSLGSQSDVYIKCEDAGQEVGRYVGEEAAHVVVEPFRGCLRDAVDATDDWALF
jgi:hypothetical protein